MTLNALRFFSIMLTAVAMAGGFAHFAHLFALPNKMGLSAEQYLTVKQVLERVLMKLQEWQKQEAFQLPISGLARPTLFYAERLRAVQRGTE